ncbi:MAG: sulfatase [Candidatus Latescibacterota bacterium]|nr:MAG: sulfatase [Candidatus Latescibacterota bacterium]
MSRRFATYFMVASLVTTTIISAVTLGCSGGEERLNVLLICVDTLRPDRLGYCGHRRNTSPTIDKLAGEGVVFEKCYSVAGWTLPAMATIFTGHYPRDHGATDFHWSIDPKLPTLTGVLRREGYDTRAYVSHVILKPEYGLADGFRSYDYSVLNVGHPHDVATAEQLTDLVINDLREIEKPFFIWAHYFDPHFAYLTHGRWASFGNTDIDRYDQEIAHTDYHIARLLRELEKKGLDDNTIVIFTSDHGEEFGEHDGQYHYTLYEEILLSPLVIKAPFLEPRASRTVVEQIDFAPTILGMLGLEFDGELPGRDVLTDSTGVRPIFFERDRPPPWVQRGVIFEGHKLFVIEIADTTKIPITSRGTYSKVKNVHPGIYMYDLSKDPAETHNLYSETDPKAKELLGLLARHFAAPRPSVHSVEVDEELKKKLRSLGYIR